MDRRRVQTLALLTVTAVGIWLCYRLAAPFLPALAWALALAVIAEPGSCWLLRHVSRPGLAAGLSVLAVALLIIGPAFFIAYQVAQQAAEWSGGLAPEHFGRQLMENPHIGPSLEWLQQRFDLPAQVRKLGEAAAAMATGLLQASLGAVVQLFLTLFILFYLLRDRDAALAALRRMMPLNDDETDWLFARVAATVYASVYGHVIVALVQGALGGLMFWWLGLPAPLLWGVAMAIAAMVPVLGPFAIWGPAAVFLLADGNWVKALILTVWGILVVGLIDNILYPALVGDKLRLHTAPVFLSILGGLALFGASGLILGPVVLSVTLALLGVWRDRTRAGRTAEQGVKPAAG